MKLRFQTVKGLSFRSSAMTNVISQLLIVKYVKANSKSAGRIAFTGDGWSFTRGWTPATRKKRCDEIHTDRAGADRLNIARCGSSCLLEIQNETTRASRATTTVPAAGPYKSTAVKTNVSDVEIEA